MLIIQCPHCLCEVEIEQINCGIFRHGVYIHNMQNIPPHSPKSQCDELVKKELIYGCGKPFTVKKINNIISVEICDYI